MATLEAPHRGDFTQTETRYKTAVTSIRRTIMASVVFLRETAADYITAYISAYKSILGGVFPQTNWVVSGRENRGLGTILPSRLPSDSSLTGLVI